MKRDENNIKEILSSIEDKINLLESDAVDTKTTLKKLLIHLKDLESTVKSFIYDIPSEVDSSNMIDDIALIKMTVDPEFVINQLMSSSFDLVELKKLELDLEEVKDMITPNIIGHS